jgi:radical SAM superfamily enzyme YgiQ (UPF0313 family)
MLPDEALQYCSSVVVGEAEDVWPTLIEDFENGGLKQKYYGKWTPLEGIVRPRRDLLNKKYRFGVIQTSRGCPYDCDFCSVTRFNGSNYRMRPVEEVLDELETIPQKAILLLDDNLIGSGMKHKNRAKDLFCGIMERGIKKRYLAQVTTDFADDEDLLRLASKAGCVNMFTGIEALDDIALEDINKRLNLRKNLGSYRESFALAQKYGITVIGAFMVGLDHEGDDTFGRIRHFVEETGLDVVQFSYMTPLPGTKLWERLKSENRIVANDFPRDWAKYDFGNIVFRTKLAPEWIRRRATEFVDDVHSWKEILRRTWRNLRNSKSVISGVTCLITNIGYRRFYRRRVLQR